MSTTLPTSEGRIPFGGASTWYRVVGESEVAGAVPVLCLHGGPGGSHDYMEPIGELARDGRRVIFYDQLGMRSLAVPGGSFQVDGGAVRRRDGCRARRRWGSNTSHVLGQSWGGMLGMEYALTQPDGVESLIICDSPSSMRAVGERGQPAARGAAGRRAGDAASPRAGGTTDSAEYLAACDVFYDRHVCRVRPYPDYVQRSFDQLAGNQVYHTMNGPSEFHCIGTLKDWDVTPRLGEIELPTLIISGAHDEATPLISRTVHEGIRGSEWVMFEDSSHMPHVEEPERFLDVVGSWLRRIEDR